MTKPDPLKLPESYFEGGPPQSQKDPGNEDRELIHELRNLNQGLELLRYIFQQMLPVLEALEGLDAKLNTTKEKQDASE